MSNYGALETDSVNNGFRWTVHPSWGGTDFLQGGRPCLLEWGGLGHRMAVQGVPLRCMRFHRPPDPVCLPARTGPHLERMRMNQQGAWTPLRREWGREGAEVVGGQVRTQHWIPGGAARSHALIKLRVNFRRPECWFTGRLFVVRFKKNGELVILWELLWEKIKDVWGGGGPPRWRWW